MNEILLQKCNNFIKFQRITTNVLTVIQINAKMLLKRR